MRIGIARRRQIGGWGFSFFLHALLLNAIVLVFRHLPVPTHTEPFRWNVTFIESPQSAAPVEPASDTSSAHELPQPGKVSEDIQAPLSQSLPSHTSQSTNGIDETMQALKSVRPRITDPVPAVSASAHAESAQLSPSTAASTPVTQDTVPLQQDVTEHPQTKMAIVPSAAEPSAPISTTMEREIPPSAPSVTDVTMAQAQSREPEQTSPTSAVPMASQQPSASQADYSWLQRAVSRRLEELKRLSRPSLDDSSQLKVLVKAVVSNTGELMEAEVVKSSGLNRIDQEAMTLVQRAFPMPLDHTLDRQQIVMRIPIIYSRD